MSDALVEEPIDESAEPQRGREWDAVNPACRIRLEDAGRLAELAEQLQVSRDALSRALMEAALDTVEWGWLHFQVDIDMREGRDTLGRFRVYTRRVVLPIWHEDEPQEEITAAR